VVTLASARTGSILDQVDAKIRAAASDEETLELWADIRAAFDEGGPNAVKAVIEERVRRSRLAVEKDLKETRSVTRSAAPKKKPASTKKPRKAAAK